MIKERDNEHNEYYFKVNLKLFEVTLKLTLICPVLCTICVSTLMVEQLPSIDCVHCNVGKEVRTAIEKIGGTMPEDLPTLEKSIQQIEKEQMARLKAKAKKGKIMLDE